MNNLKMIRRKFKQSGAELAQALGVSQATISVWENLPFLKPENAKLVADYYKIPIEDLIGKDNDFSYVKTSEFIDFLENLDLSSLKVSEGIKKNGLISINKNFLRNIGVENPKNVKMAFVQDDSMFPKLSRNDIVFIDTAHKSPSTEGMYAFVINGILIIKHISLDPITRQIYLKSENGFVTPIDLKNEIETAGKIIAYIKFTE